MISANYYGAVNPSESTAVTPVWTRTFKDATEMEKAKGFDAPKQPANRSVNPMQSTGKAVIRDHDELDLLGWEECGHSGRPEALAGWDKSGKPSYLEAKHSALGEMEWEKCGHVGKADNLAGFDSYGKPSFINPAELMQGLPDPGTAKGLIIASTGTGWEVLDAKPSITGVGGTAIAWNNAAQEFVIVPFLSGKVGLFAWNGSAFGFIYPSSETAKYLFTISNDTGISPIAIPETGTHLMVVQDGVVGFVEADMVGAVEVLIPGGGSTNIVAGVNT